jgi:hypothetical protein
MVMARRQGGAEVPGWSGVGRASGDSDELEGEDLAAFLDSGMGGRVAAGDGRRGVGCSVNTKLGRASRSTRDTILVAPGSAGAAVATQDKTRCRGRWGIERLVEGRSAGFAAFEHYAGRHERGLSV